MFVQGHQTSIVKFRFSPDGRDPINARLDWGRVLSSADLHPASLPDENILCVKKLVAIAPSPMHQRFIDTDWQQLVRGSLSDMAARAERLSAANPASDADAIIFLNLSALMACLARDWCAGNVRARWWWRALLRNDDTFWTTWVKNPEHIPAAMTHLARANGLIEFAAAITEPEARTLTRRVVEAFALHTLGEVFEWSMAQETSTQDQPERSKTNQVWRGADLEALSTQVSAPWQEVLPGPAANSLPLPQQLFVGLVLMIHRAPSLVRTQRFALDVARWHRQQLQAESELIEADRSDAQARSSRVAQVRDLASPEVREAPIEIVSNQDQKELAAKSELSQSGPNGTDHFEHVAATGSEIHDLSNSGLGSIEVPEASAEQTVQNPPPILTYELLSDLPKERSITPPQPAAIVSEHEIDEVRFVSTEYEVEDLTVLAEAHVESMTSPSLETEAFADVEIETNLGGFFYLINFALHLDLYGDFTRPAEAGIELNIWDFVSLIGSELTGDMFGTDPIFDLLAMLAGREQQAPAGENFEPSDDWRIPVEWLSAFDAKGVWTWNVIDDRLRVCHANGFQVVDLRIESSEVEAQLTRELEPYRNLFVGIKQTDLQNDAANCELRTSRAVQLWLSRLMPYLRARLRAALGAGAPEDLGPYVCRQNAVVRASEMRVDVFFNLCDHPIELRLAGLDRNPGWVPAAGRFISFHYN
jgi:hypothetical protein